MLIAGRVDVCSLRSKTWACAVTVVARRKFKMKKKRELGYSSVLEDLSSTQEMIISIFSAHKRQMNKEGEEGVLNGIGSKALWDK